MKPSIGSVIMLAPLLLVLGASVRRQSSDTEAASRAPTPWFVIFFISVVILNSTIQVPEAVRASVVQATAFLLTMALAAIGLQTDLGRLRAKGMRPLMLGAISSLFISLLGLGLILGL